jgi:hypothetical protein
LSFNFKSLQESNEKLVLEGTIKPPCPLYLQFISISQDLFRWHWNWELQHGGSADEVRVTASDLVTEENGNLWYPTHISFPGRPRGLEIIYYNAALIYLFRMARQFQWGFRIESIDREAPPEITQRLPPTPLLLASAIHTLEDTSSEFYHSVEGCLSVAPNEAGDWYQVMFALFWRM